MNWEEIENTPHEAFYQSEDGDILYICDTHSNRLRETGDQYHLVYSGNATSVDIVDTANELKAEHLDITDIGLSAEEILDNEKAVAD